MIDEIIKNHAEATEFLDDCITMAEAIRCYQDRGVSFLPEANIICLKGAEFERLFPGAAWQEVESLQEMFPGAAKKQAEYRGITFETWKPEA